MAAMNVFDQATRSLWMDIDVAPGARALAQDIEADAVVVGAGIAGLSIAYELALAGRSVVVLDRGKIGSGMTARTTAHLTPICDDLISELIKLRGEAAAKLFQESQSAAVDRIEEIVRELDIQCNFRRLDGYLFPALGTKPSEAKEKLETEFEAGRKIGVELGWAKGLPFEGLEDTRCLRYPRQATFHPAKYLRGLAAAITQHGGRLFANSPVVKVEENGDGVTVTTEAGHTVRAQHAAIATNSPINDRVTIHSKQAPYRSYAMAFTIPRDTLPDALWWDMADPYHYVRLNPGPGATDYLIAGGADHKSGEADDGDVRFAAIEAWIRNLAPKLGKEVARWSGQLLDPVDYTGFIGRNPGDEHIFIVTGDSGQGMTHGALAGLLLKALMVEGSSSWQEIYDPGRKTSGSIANFVSENLTALKNFAEQLMPSSDEGDGHIDSASNLKPGEGAVIHRGEQKIAAFRDRSGKLHQHSAKCTHLGCEVQWNSTEQCWDCPCHGSQFSARGEVLNGPAISDLELVKQAEEPRKERAAS